MFSTCFQRAGLIVFFCLSAVGVSAQEYLYEIGGMAGGSFYMGDANKNVVFKNTHPSAGLLFRYNANFRIAFRGNLAWARVSGTTEGLDNVFPNNEQVSFQRDVIDLGGQMEFNFFPYSDQFKYLNTKRISPYIAAGLGVSAMPGDGGFLIGPHLSLSTGVKYKLKNRVNIGAEWTIRKLFSDAIDVNGSSDLLNDPYGTGSGLFKNRDWYSMLTIAISYDFGLRCNTCNKKDMLDY